MKSKPRRKVAPTTPTVVDPTLMEKLFSVRQKVNHRVIERESHTDAAILTLLASSTCFFYGDVGTAKTYHFNLLAKLLDLKFFDILLSETTKPDKIFGPTDIPALANGIQRVKTKGYAPDAELIFFDEIFKANDIVLNDLLWLVNEKIYRNGDEGVQKTPLIATFSASNEIPTEDKFKAIYDRLLLRMEIDYIRSYENLKLMVQRQLRRSSEQLDPVMGKPELTELQSFVPEVKLSNEVYEAALRIRDGVKSSVGLRISDRRFLRSLRFVQAAAVLAGRTKAEVSDTEILSNLFWEQPEQRVKVRALTLAQASSDVADLLAYAEMAGSIWETALATGNMEQAAKRLNGIGVVTAKLTSKAGLEIHRQVTEFANRAAAILANRADFVVLRIDTEEERYYRVSVASAALWAKEQLRSVGFRWYRASEYWWQEIDGKNTAESDAKLQAKVKTTLNVDPVIKVISS